MRITATHPGRHGDILWALPTVRAIAQAYETKVNLVIPAQYGGLADLLAQQAYIGSVLALSPEAWPIQQTAPITPRYPKWQTSQPPDRLFHLGYADWPSPTLPEDVYERACKLGVGSGAKAGDPILPALDLTTPWIVAEGGGSVDQILSIGFTDEYFELKYGLADLVSRARHWTRRFCFPEGSRWDVEGTVHGVASWRQAASILARSRVFLGCCSALHVLAVALGTPVVVMEPNPDRWNSVFWPCRQDGPQVTLVRGNDGQPTFDARHCAEVIERVLGGRR